MNRRGIMIVLSGFSGVGKGTLVRELLRAYDNYALSVSMTTRKPREGELEGVSYYFVDRDAFEKTIAEDGLIEYAQYCGNYYGTPRRYVENTLAEGRDVILEIEIQGALKIKERFPQALLLYVMPPCAAELKKRLVGRGTEEAAVIEKRLKRAREEAEGIENYDYIVINDDLEECVREVHGIITAARRTPDRNEQFIAEIRSELDTLVGEK